MISYYELLPNSVILRLRSDLRKEFERCEIKGYLPMLVMGADKVTKCIRNRRLVDNEEYEEALSMVDPLAIWDSIEKHSQENNNVWKIEKAVLNDFGANKEREDVSKSMLLFLLILKVILTLLISWWWEHNKPEEKLDMTKLRTH